MSLIIGSLFGLTAIALGAYIEHGLHNIISAHQVDMLDTALRYQQLHAIIICMIALAQESTWRIAKYTLLSVTNFFFILGVLLFSGSIYASVFLSDPTWVHITPYGGSTLMLAWLCLCWVGWQARRARSD